MTKIKPTKNKDFDTWREIILSLCKNPNSLNWGGEIKMLKTLLKKYPDLDFWKSLDLGFKINSLAYFLTEDGAEFLKRLDKVSQVILPEQKKYALEETETQQSKAATTNNKNTTLNFLTS